MRHGTKTEFKKLFASRTPIKAEAWWVTATPIIASNLALEIVGKPNELLPVAEYLVKHTTAGTPRATQIYEFLSECHAFRHDWRASWDSKLELMPGSARSSYRHYLSVLPNQPAPPIVHRDLPRTSRHWDVSDQLTLRQLFDELVTSFEAEHGTSLLGYYVKLQDALASQIEKLVGVPFATLLHYSHYRATAEQKLAIQTLVKNVPQAIQQAVDIHVESFGHAYESSANLRADCEKWMSFDLDACRRGHIWDEKRFLYGFAYECREVLRETGSDLDALYSSGHSLCVTRELQIVWAARGRHIDQIWRQAENILRSRKGMRPIGEGWVSEAKLVSALREAFPQEIIEAQASPKWLGRFRFDLYFPARNIAVEYHGEQHFGAVSIFGGESGLITTQSRDRKKRELCEQNGCLLIEVPAGAATSIVIQQVRDAIACKPADSNLTVATGRSGIAPIAPKKFRVTLGAHDPNACARHGTGELIRKLAEAGTDFVKLQKRKRDSLLYVAAEAGNLDALRAFIEIGLDVNARNCQRGTTALARLCTKQRYPDLNAVRLLLESGADVTNAAKGCDVYGYYAPPLIASAVSLNVPLSQLLREFGADINIRHKETGMTAFLAVIGNSRSPGDRKRLEILEWLVREGADTRARNLRNENALDLLFRHRPGGNAWLEVSQMLGFLLRHRPSVSRALEALVKFCFSDDPRPEYSALLEYAETSRKEQKASRLG